MREQKLTFRLQRLICSIVELMIKKLLPNFIEYVVVYNFLLEIYIFYTLHRQINNKIFHILNTFFEHVLLDHQNTNLIDQQILYNFELVTISCL